MLLSKPGAGVVQWSGSSPAIRMCLTFDSQTRRHVRAKFVVGSLLCSERFLSRNSGVLLSLKTNFPKLQFDSGMHENFRTSSCELLSAPWVNKLHLNFHFFPTMSRKEYILASHHLLGNKREKKKTFRGRVSAIRESLFPSFSPIFRQRKTKSAFTLERMTMQISRSQF